MSTQKPNPFSKDYISQIVLPPNAKVIKKITRVPERQQITLGPRASEEGFHRTIKMRKASI